MFVVVVYLTLLTPDKELYELLQKIEGCGYFDKPHEEEDEEEEEEEEEEEVSEVVAERGEVRGSGRREEGWLGGRG